MVYLYSGLLGLKTVMHHMGMTWQTFEDVERLFREVLMEHTVVNQSSELVDYIKPSAISRVRKLMESCLESCV